MDKQKQAQKYLHTYRSLKERINYSEIVLARLTADSSPGARKEILAIHKKIREWSELCLEIDRQIDTLPALEKAILRHRYIFFEPWDKICEKLSLDQNQVRDTHQRALRLIGHNLK